MPHARYLGKKKSPLQLRQYLALCACDVTKKSSPYPRKPADFPSPELWAIIASCWRRDGAQRPAAAAMLRDYRDWRARLEHSTPAEIADDEPVLEDDKSEPEDGVGDCD